MKSIFRGFIGVAVVLLVMHVRADDCSTSCWTLDSYCLAQGTPSDVCLLAYSDCVSKCFLSGTGGVAPGTPPLYAYGFPGAVTYGTMARWSGSYTNPFYRLGIGDRKSTLHLSWTPPNAQDPTTGSGPEIGPFSLGFGYRFELLPHERQNVVVDFRPTLPAETKSRLYVWWEWNDGKGGHGFKWQEMIDFFGHGGPPPAPAAGSGSGQGGGAESFPPFLFAKAGTLLPTLSGARPPKLWKAPSAVADEVTVPHRRAVGRGPALTLRDLMPATLASLQPTFHLPDVSVIGGGNALDALAADYVDSGGNIRVVVLAFRSHVDVYAHVYSVCARVKGGWLEDVRFPAVAVPGSAAPATFWQSTMSVPDSTGVMRKEVATGFAAYLSSDARSATVDSHWLTEQYPLHSDPSGEVFTLQVWAPDAETTAAARTAVLDNLARRATVSYRNTSSLPTPSLFIAHGDYAFDGATLWTVNNSGAERSVDFTAITWSAANDVSERRYNFTRTIPPGAGTVWLEMPGRLNGVVYMSESGSPWADMIYFADGNWFSYGESTPPPFDVPACPATYASADDFVLAGCAHLVSDVPADGWRGVGRAMTTYTRHLTDVHSQRAISFFAKGSELPAEVQLVSLTDDGRAAAYVATFTPSPAGRQVTIPFTWLASRDVTQSAAFTGQRLLQVTWDFSGGPYPGAELLIGNVFFTADLVLEPGPMPASRPATGAPVPVVARLEADLPGQKGTLSWRRRGDAAFTPVTMQRTGEVWFANMPAQPLGTTVESYVEVTDEAGRTVAMPPDAPYETTTFVVSERPAVLVDDFDSRVNRNLRGGAEWTFRSPAASLTEERTGTTVRLRWDVNAPGSFSGWVSPLHPKLDASLLDALTLRVRGVAGGERVKIGLGDATGQEHKVLLAKFIDGGIGSDWRSARIPLSVFATIDRAAIVKLLLVFENSVAARAGEVEIDDIMLISTGTRLAIPIERFDDGTSEDALGGNVFTVTGGGAGIVASHDANARNGSTGAGYRVTTSGGIGSYATLGFDLRGVDARTQQQLRFSIRGNHGGEQLNLYLVSQPLSGAETRRFVDLSHYLGVTTAYQQASIPLADFAALGIDLSALQRLEFVWEGRPFADTIDLDDIDLSP